MLSNLFLLLGFALRLFPSGVALTNVLDNFPLFSTPLSSYRSIQESLFLHQVNLTDSTHHPPLLLKLYSFLSNGSVNNIFWAWIDIMVGASLVKVAKKILPERQNHLAFFYAFSPFALLCTYAKSEYLLSNFVLINMINAVLDSKFFAAWICLAFATYLDYYCWYFAIPISYWFWISASNKNNKLIKLFGGLILFIISLSGLLILSRSISGNWDFLQWYLTAIQFKKLIPNTGLWWYFFTEIFGSFREFYLCLFNIYGFIYFIPVSYRFMEFKKDNKIRNKQSILFVFYFLLTLNTFIHPYPTLTHHLLSLFLIFPLGVDDYIRLSPLIIHLAYGIWGVMCPVFYYVWMGSSAGGVGGGGNANFFYALGLVGSVGLGFMLSDVCWGWIKKEWELDFGRSEDLDKLTQL
ncbi:GPI-anchor transamidase subunit [Martiniozyma asiatica (nom. inval.)]|nr:GPI-anchor transamidase subunit [Martiniozyma asiatica]